MPRPFIYINGWPGIGKHTIARALQTLLSRHGPVKVVSDPKTCNRLGSVCFPPSLPLKSHPDRPQHARAYPQPSPHRPRRRPPRPLPSRLPDPTPPPPLRPLRHARRGPRHLRNYVRHAPSSSPPLSPSSQDPSRSNPSPPTFLNPPP